MPEWYKTEEKGNGCLNPNCIFLTYNDETKPYCEYKEKFLEPMYLKEMKCDKKR